jgi:hypothetical protein
MILTTGVTGGRWGGWFSGTNALSGLLGTLPVVSSPSNVVLEAVGVKSYAELVALGTDEVIRRLDDRRMYVPLNPGDAFLAVLVLSAVADLRETSKSLDAAKRGFERATIALAASGVILTVATVVLAIVAL